MMEFLRNDHQPTNKAGSRDAIASKKTPKYLSFASVIKHSLHFSLQYLEGPNLAAQIPIVQWRSR